MHGLQIPETEWQEFCEYFTRRHRGWLVTMRQLDLRELSTNETVVPLTGRLFTRDRPLQELREGHDDDRRELMVTVGQGKDETSYLIENVVALFSRKIGLAHRRLRVDANNGEVTLIDFRTAGATEAPVVDL